MSSRIRIAEGEEGAERPYENLLPLVDALVAGGNRWTSPTGPFYRDRDGWRCDMEDALDFEMIEELFELPPSIEVSPAYGTVLDRNTWVIIEGDAG